MNKHTTSKLLLTAVLAVPFYAFAGDIGGPGCGGGPQATPAQEAKNFAKAAGAKAEDNAETIASMPVEFAGMTVVMAYGGEELPAVGADKAEASAKEILQKKLVYWAGVKSGLAQAQDEVGAELDALSKTGKFDDMAAKMRESQEIVRLQSSVEAVIADIDADKAYIAALTSLDKATYEAREKNADIRKRKAEVFKALKPKTASKPA